MTAAMLTDDLFEEFPVMLSKCVKLLPEKTERTDPVTVEAWGREYVQVKVRYPSALDGLSYNRVEDGGGS